ncbi:MAG: hypothetical protein GTN59_08100, partial [Candidatus Dadabacteria bacterium]|nr:hypothetical protein [Candidatus Dadabacteria bacterium]
SMIDMLAADGPTPEESFLSKELMSKISYALNNIPIIEQKIIKMKFGVENDE